MPEDLRFPKRPPGRGGIYYNLSYRGVLRPDRFSALPPLVGELYAERAIRAAGRVIAKSAFQRMVRQVRARTGNLHGRGVVVRGSARVSYIPSARLAGAPHLHLIEFGHRIVVHGVDTGKRTRAFKLVTRSIKKNRTGQIKAMSNQFNRDMSRLQIETLRNNLKSREQAKRYVQRVLKQERDARRRYG